MAITAEELRVKVTADTKDAERGLDNVSEKSGGLKKGFGAAKAAVAGFAGAAVVGLAGKTVMAASDLNETVSKTGVVFGKETDTVTGYAQQMADSFGLPKVEILNAASQFGLLGKAAGVSGKPLADMSTNLAGLAADAMSFYNVPLEQALGDFSSALAGESEPVKKYGILMNEAAVQSEALALGLVKPTKNLGAIKAAQVNAAAAQKRYTDAVKKHGPNSLEAQKAEVALSKAQDGVKKAMEGTIPKLTEGQKVMARQSLITKGLKDASGDLERTQSSVSNRIREVSGRIQNLAADYGTKALPAVASFLGIVLDLMGKLPALVGFLRDNAQTIGIVAGIIGAVLLPRLVAWGVQSTIAAAKSVAAWTTTQARAIASSWAQIGAGLRVIGSWVAMGVAATVNAAKMATAWVVGIIRQAAVAAAAMAAQAARIVAQWVLMGVQSLIQAARMAAAWVIAMGPVGWVIAAVVALVALIIANWDTVKAWTIKAWTAVSDWVKSAWQAIVGWVTGFGASVNAKITALWNGVKALTSRVWNGIKSAVSAVLNGIKAAISAYFGMYRTVITTAWNLVKSVTTRAWNGIKSAVSGALNGLLSLVRGIPGRIRSALGNLGGLLVSSGRSIIQGLIDGIRGMAGNVTGAVKGVLQAARNLLPFSPAKEGPFSGKGWTLYSGRSISAALAEGIGDNAAKVRREALGLAQAAVPPVAAASLPGAVLGRPGAAAGLRPSELAGSGARAGSGATITQNIYYPVNEKTSVATNRGLQRIAALPIG